MQRALDERPSLWLVLGIALIATAHMRWGIGVLAFLAPVPFLRYLRLTTGWQSRLLFFAATFVGWSGAVAKIVTEPLSLAMVPLFALPITLFLGVPYLGWDALRRRLGDGVAAVATFPALMVLGELAQYSTTPFASWGAAAYTQGDNLVLLQVASLAGMAGVSALVYLVAASLESGLERGARGARAELTVAAAVMAASLVFGGIRLVLASDAGEQAAVVAAVNTDFTMTPDGTMPDGGELEAVWLGLERRTRLAAASGAQLVVWNEASTLVFPEDEQTLVQGAAALARELQVELVASYVVPLSLEPLSVEVKYAWLRPDGSLDHSYVKHHPVAGGPVVRGEGPVGVVDTAVGRASGAICYDYDYPAMGLEHARAGADIVALPSSDWRGIDPIHTQMAALRAIEGGHSVLRSTRWGLSAGIDHHGRLRGWLSHFDDTEQVLVVHLPTRGVTTVYGVLGNWLPVFAGLGLVGALGLARRRRASF